MMHKNRSVDTHQFAMVPRAEIPRASFKMQHTHKTTFDAGYLIPVYVDEVLPGDTFKLRMTAFARLATPLFPIMDNLHLESFFFFCPNRLLWRNFKRFMGEQDNPADSTSYVVPVVQSVAGGFAVGSIFDYFGLPTVGQVDPAGVVTANALPLRAYNLIYNTWFRDENLQNSSSQSGGTHSGSWPGDDGPDGFAGFNLLRRGKRHDYFTSALPWPQKGSAVSLPIGSSAPVTLNPTLGIPMLGKNAATHVVDPNGSDYGVTAGAFGIIGGTPSVLDPNGSLIADLSAATAATINQLRQAFQIQKLLERDARGGTRYTEIVRAHFGVISPDARLQRPEYLGGGHTDIVINPIAQTSATGVTGGATPTGNLAAVGTALAHGHGFSQSFTEHGYIIGLLNVRADLTYQQGMRRMWSRSTRYDFYFPAFAMLGEQAVLNKEIYAQGTSPDNDVFGYQERWAEYRYHPSRISGLFRSTSTGTIDPWHLAQRFTSLPVLGDAFIQDNPPLSRVLAVGAGANGQQILCDMFFDVIAARPMPLYSVPGLIDHF